MLQKCQKQAKTKRDGVINPKLQFLKFVFRQLSWYYMYS